MNEENILDALNKKLPTKDKLPYAILAGLFITIPLLISTFFRLSGWWLILIQYISVITALYFFIKKTNPQPDVISFSAWGILVVFLGHTFSSLVHYIFFYKSITYINLEIIFFALGNLFKSLFIGYPLYLGVFLWIKKRNWVMLVLMTIVSFMFLTMLYLDRSLKTI